MSFSVAVVLGVQEDREDGTRPAGTCVSRSGQSVTGVMDLGLVASTASRLPPFYCLLAVCRNELTQFAKPPVLRLRVVVEWQFECHCTVTSCSHCQKWEERWKEKGTSFKIPVACGGKT